jgi:DNA polymerase III subunit gamma/tau
MESFIVSARKYRPSRFEDVIGQPQVTNTLRNALQTNQVAQAFLFCGPRGVGKTTCARILAKAVNCENLGSDSEPCNECASCRAFNQNASFNIIELDAASNNSVEDIRTLTDQVRFAPQAGKKKIYIIDEVHMLSTSAFNAFLKTLEEPPPYAIFILATTEKHKIIPTILSRCQVFDFQRIGTTEIVSHLKEIAEKEKIDFDDEALHLVAMKADGAMRDALSMFDRISIFSNGKVHYENVLENLNMLDYEYYFKFTEFILSEDISQCFLLFNDILKKGFDGEHFLAGFADHLRNLLVAKDQSTISLIDFTQSVQQRYFDQAEIIPSEFLISALSILNEAEFQYKASRNKRLSVEVALMKLCMLNEVINGPAKDAEELKKKPLKPEVPSKANHQAEKIISAPLQPVDIQLQAVQPIKKNGNERLKIKKLEEVHSFVRDNEQKIQDEKTEIIDEPIDAFAFQQVWKNYLDKLRAEDNAIVLNILEIFPPELIEHRSISIKVGNGAHYHALMAERETMHYFLKKELDKKTVSLQIEIDRDKASEASPSRPYRATEKFEFLAKKNPKLRELRDRLKLDLDY